MDTKPLTASMAPIETPSRVYFFERPDGSRIQVTERAAWDLYSRPQQTMWGHIKFKYLGTSDGSLYALAVREANTIFREQGLEAAQAHLRQAWEKELEVALTDKTLPPNYDKVDKNGRPTDMGRI